MVINVCSPVRKGYINHEKKNNLKTNKQKHGHLVFPFWRWDVLNSKYNLIKINVWLWLASNHWATIAMEYFLNIKFNKFHPKICIKHCNDVQEKYIITSKREFYR